MDGSRYNPEQDNHVPDCVVGQLMRLAVQGWATQENIPMQGLPALPARRAFLPYFIMLLHQPDWRDTLQDLAQAGMDNQDMQNTVQRACDAHGIKWQMVKALAQLAA